MDQEAVHIKGKATRCTIILKEEDNNHYKELCLFAKQIICSSSNSPVNMTVLKHTAALC